MNQLRNHSKTILYSLVFVFVGVCGMANLSAEQTYTPQASFYADEGEGWALTTLFKFSLIGAAIISIIFLIFSKVLNEYKKSRALSMIFLHQIMIKDPITAERKESLNSVIAKFKEFHIHYLPVVSELKHLEGVVSRDGIDKELAAFQVDLPSLKEGEVLLPENLTAQKVMTKSTIALSPYDTLAKAVKVMEKNPCKCIPIVDEGKHVLGILTEDNIVEAINQHFIKTQLAKESSPGIKIQPRPIKDSDQEDKPDEGSNLGNLFSQE